MVDNLSAMLSDVDFKEDEEKEKQELEESIIIEEPIVAPVNNSVKVETTETNETGETGVKKRRGRPKKTENKEVKVSINNNIHFSKWFEKYMSTNEDISLVKIVVRGVDPIQTVLLSAPSQTRRVLVVWNNSGNYYLPDQAPFSFKLLSTGFIIGFKNDDSDEIMNIVGHNGKILNFKEKVMGEHILPIECDINKKTENCDKEKFLLLYPQLKVCIGDVTTNEDLIKYFIERKKDVRDINHILLLNNLLRDLLK